MTDQLSNSRATADDRSIPRAMVVADNAHVTYRVFASGKRVSARDNALSLRALRGGRDLTSVPAVRGISFTASEGETIGVVGHNGSGKSTLFRAISGLIPTSEGSILVRERPVLLGVNAALVPELSGENNIKLGLLAMGFSSEEASAHVDKIAEFAELNEFIHHPMRTYSAGMGARLRFAIASAKAHSILLIDEALAVGDKRFRAKSERRIAELRASAGLVMIVSHSLGSLEETCDRVLWVHKGELRADGPTSDVISDYIKWTKNPGSVAVGAASKPTPKNLPPKASVKGPAPDESMAKKTNALIDASSPHESPGQPQTSSPKGQLDPAASGLSLLEELLKGLEAETPQEAAKSVVETAPVVGDSPRDIARRERYQRASRMRVRRRTIAALITGAVILLAVGVGAAFALLTNSAADAGLASSSSAELRDDVLAQQPVIVSFSAGAEPVSCDSEAAQATAKLSWDVAGATYVQVASGPLSMDIATRPTTMPMKTADYKLPYACGAETQVYTLWAENEDGTRVTKEVVVIRTPLPATAPPGQSTSRPNRPVPPSSDPVMPVAPVIPSSSPAPVPPVNPSTEPSSPPSEPTPEPTPADPLPSEEPTLPPDGADESEPPTETPTT
ncbi:ABC transporter ATP-binding protein [Microbacterium sp.]|uniref:ABC transporter ATP-binding protein n=1 Tax=Microbacterium sp. TaxID=51671 RepID=UPI0028B14FB6|nr:ABC transporter ATP-binding protein [Microbacterium sp.]